MKTIWWNGSWLNASYLQSTAHDHRFSASKRAAKRCFNGLEKRRQIGGRSRQIDLVQIGAAASV